MKTFTGLGVCSPTGLGVCYPVHFSCVHAFQRFFNWPKTTKTCNQVADRPMLDLNVCCNAPVSSSDSSVLKSLVNTNLVRLWMSCYSVCLSFHQIVWMKRRIFQASLVMLFCIVLCSKPLYSPLLHSLDFFPIWVAGIFLRKKSVTYLFCKHYARWLDKLVPIYDTCLWFFQSSVLIGPVWTTSSI